MALRLNRSVQQETTSTETPGTNKGFDVSGVAGNNYDLDEIVKSKSRNSTSELNVQATDKKNKKEGSIAVKLSDEKILMNNADAAKYLFGNESSTNAYTPAVTLRRPIVLWEEGTLDDGTTERVESIYEQINRMEQNMDSKIEEKVKSRLLNYLTSEEFKDTLKGYYDASQIDNLFYTKTTIDSKLYSLSSKYDEKHEDISDKVEEIYPDISDESEDFKISCEFDKDYLQVKYFDKEIRIYISKVGGWIDNDNDDKSSTHLCSFKVYAPKNAKYIKERLDANVNNLDNVEIKEFSPKMAGIALDSKKYSSLMVPVAFKNIRGNWIYYGSSSSKSHFIGYFYNIEWYDENKDLISKDSIRINLVASEDQLNDPTDHSIN